MGNTIGLRATSFVASTALLSLAVIAGLTMTIVQRQLALPPDGPSVSIVDPPRNDPPSPPREPDPPVQPLQGEAILPFDPPQQEANVQLVSNDPPTAAGPPLITNPDWVHRPRDLARYYPARPLQRGIEGRVVLDCAVSVRGTLNCAVVSETPANWGFAEAALRISRDYQMVPATRNGTPIEARHRMVIPFQVR